MPITAGMEHCGLHPIDEYLFEDWLDEWVSEGIREVEAYLGKHAAFHAFLVSRTPS